VVRAPEAWQRQLSALINLQQNAPAEAAGVSRLVWLVAFDPRFGLTAVEVREQSAMRAAAGARAAPWA
jgi:hypothetical protein